MTRRKAPDPPGQDCRSAPVMTSWVFVMVETARDISFTGMRPLTHPVFRLVLFVRDRGRDDGAPMVAPMAGDWMGACACGGLARTAWSMRFGVVDTLAMAAFSSETSPKSASCCCGLSSCVSCMLAFSCPRLSRDIFQPPLSSSSARLTSGVLMDTLTVRPRSRWKRRRAGHDPAHSGRQERHSGTCTDLRAWVSRFLLSSP